MFFRQIYQRELAQASYLIGCQATGEAMVVDPNRNIQLYLDLAAQEGLRITAVTETHIHADFVSGARELAQHTGATLYLSGMGPLEWRYEYAQAAGATLIHADDSFMVGNLTIAVWHTPGHTPEHVAFLVTDSANADAPMGMLTGDSVFVGDVGRPDLLERAAGVAGTMAASATQLYDTLQRIKTVPDFVQIWPGHGAGSACGKALGAVPHSTIGYEKRFNWAMRAQDEAAFVADVLAGQPEPPTYFARMKQVNRDGPSMQRVTPLEQLPANAVVAQRDSGALLIDLRRPKTFATGSIPGALNIAWGDVFLKWSGWLVPADRPIALIGEPAEVQAAAEQLRLIGIDQVIGFWTPAIVQDWQANGGEVATVGRITAQAAERLISAGQVAVLDVRNADEYAEGHIAGSQHIPLGTLPRHLDQVATDHPVLVHCQGGVRSPIAASVLTGAGFAGVLDLIGGMDAWQSADRPVQTGAFAETNG